ncbi:MAG: S1C family serine protease [Mariniblastus sp.]
MNPKTKIQIAVLVATVIIMAQPITALTAQSFTSTVAQTQPKMVKIVGSGGFEGLEPYQSGFLISKDGLVLTVWSYVLDSDVVKVTLNDGQKFDATLVGYDPRIEIAILKVNADDLTSFNLDEAIESTPGNRILAFSNLYGVATGNEPTSVQHGIVSAKTKLSARRGAFDSTYQGDVYVLDAVTNNPGAAGGAITDRRGRLIGLIGKELRNSKTNSWLNFAVPISQLTTSIEKIRSGEMVVRTKDQRRKPTEPITMDLAGIVLVLDIVSRTPPYIDRVVADSVAAKAGLLADDLIIEVNGQMTPSRKELEERLSYIDRDSDLNLTIQRGKEFKSIEIRLVR